MALNHTSFLQLARGKRMRRLYHGSLAMVCTDKISYTDLRRVDALPMLANLL